MVNYTSIKKFSLWRAHYYFADSNNKTADEVFARHGLKVKRVRNPVSQGSEYMVVRCSVRKKDIPLFEKCMVELVNEMLLTDRSDYCAYCMEVEQWK